MQAPKNGFFYVLDRTDGTLISAQPFATINWASGVDLTTGRPIENPEARYPNPKQPFLAMPGPLGAHNWHPMSFSPQTGLVYLPTQDTGYVYVDDANYQSRPIGFNVGIDMIAPTLPQDPPTKTAMLAGLRGTLQARDPVTQKVVWSVQHDSSWNGGVLSTAGELVFQGNALGEVVGYAARNGEKLWSFGAQTGVVAPPISYEIDGEQYIAVVAGWGGAMPITGGEAARKGAINVNRSRVLAFKLGAKEVLPEPAQASALAAPPPRIKDADQITKGKAAFLRSCAVCHGDAAVGSGVIPDLRHSAMIQSTDAWKAIVIDGTLTERGMVSFSPVLNASTAEAIRAYVIDRANDERDESSEIAAR
jgi:alcohol dehydrogenase (cytochrome c)/quinohemoprotein ethanol dehydrogenase